MAESFFSTLEFEGQSTTTWRYVSDGEPELFTFIERYYKQTRLHSHNGYKTRTRPKLTAQWCAGGIDQVSPESGQAQGVYLINGLVEFNFAPAATINWAVLLYKNGAVMANTDTTVISGALSQSIPNRSPSLRATRSLVPRSMTREGP